jgi:hypothetical protein
MLKEDEVYFHCFEQAENLIDRGYISNISVEDLTQKLIAQLEKSPRWKEILEGQWSGEV